MVEADTVRRLALALPDVVESARSHDRLGFELANGERLAWTFLRRIDPRKPRVPDPEVLVVRCPIPRKELLVEAAPDRFFDDDHYRRYPAVMVRLAAIEEDELGDLLRDAAEICAAAKPKRKR